METTAIETEVLAIGPATPIDRVANTIQMVDALMARAKEIKSHLEGVLIGYIEQNGELTIGTIRYYIGAKKTTKCQDVPATVEALLNAVGGDFQRFCEHLSASSIKHGAARQTLTPEEYGRLFTTTEEPSLEEGKPRKQLQKVDTRFVRGKEAADYIT